MNICLKKYIYTYICICIHMHIYIYTHTYVYIHIYHIGIHIWLIYHPLCIKLLNSSYSSVLPARPSLQWAMAGANYVPRGVGVWLSCRCQVTRLLGDLFDHITELLSYSPPPHSPHTHPLDHPLPLYPSSTTTDPSDYCNVIKDGPE